MQQSELSDGVSDEAMQDGFAAQSDRMFQVPSSGGGSGRDSSQDSPLPELGSELGGGRHRGGLDCSCARQQRCCIQAYP